MLCTSAPRPSSTACARRLRRSAEETLHEPRHAPSLKELGPRSSFARVALENRVPHRRGDARGAHGGPDESARDTGVGIGVASVCEGLAKGLLVSRPSKQVLESIHERDANEPDLREEIDPLPML